MPAIRSAAAPYVDASRPRHSKPHRSRDGTRSCGCCATPARSADVPRYDPDVALSIAVAQLNPTVGDVARNALAARVARDTAAGLGADLVVFSELFLVGYPPEDLVLRPALVEAAARALDELTRESTHGR